MLGNPKSFILLVRGTVTCCPLLLSFIKPRDMGVPWGPRLANMLCFLSVAKLFEAHGVATDIIVFAAFRRLCFDNVFVLFPNLFGSMLSSRTHPPTLKDLVAASAGARCLIITVWVLNISFVMLWGRRCFW